MTSSAGLDSKPQITSYPIATSESLKNDILRLLDEGKIIGVITGIFGSFFHACDSQTKSQEEIACLLANKQVVCLSVSRQLELANVLNDESLMKKACACNLKNRLCQLSDIPHIWMIEFGHYK